MLRIITLFITIPLALFALLYAVSNTGTVDVKLDIIGFEAELKHYIVFLATLALGFLSGTFLVWLNLYPYRIKAWRKEKALSAREEEITQLKSKIDELEQRETELTAVKQQINDAEDYLSDMSDGDDRALPAYYDK